MGRSVSDQKKAISETYRSQTEKSDEAAKEAQIRELKRIDQEVRAHEQAHMAAAGDLARGGPSYSYTQGPDGRQYATGGEVQIDNALVAGDPDATIRKMQRVIAAALAPGDPSGQDLSVASQARAEISKAQVEKLQSNNEESGNSRRDNTLSSKLSVYKDSSRETSSRILNLRV